MKVRQTDVAGAMKSDELLDRAHPVKEQRKDCLVNRRVSHWEMTEVFRLKNVEHVGWTLLILHRSLHDCSQVHVAKTAPAGIKMLYCYLY